MRKGFIALWRRFQQHDLWKEPRKFHDAEAWIDLLLSANGIDGHQKIGRYTVPVKRGSLVASVRYLSERWTWSKGKVVRFLEWLRGEGMITLTRDTKWTQVTIVNYETYNPTRDSQRDGGGTVAGRTKQGKTKENPPPPAAAPPEGGHPAHLEGGGGDFLFREAQERGEIRDLSKRDRTTLLVRIMSNVRKPLWCAALDRANAALMSPSIQKDPLGYAIGAVKRFTEEQARDQATRAAALKPPPYATGLTDVEEKECREKWKKQYRAQLARPE